MIHNLCAILDLRLQRWLNVVEPLPLAFYTPTSLNCDAEGRLCAFCVTPGKQLNFLGERRDLRQYNLLLDNPSALVTWCGPIECVRFESNFINASRLVNANMRFIFNRLVPLEQLARHVALLHNLTLPKA